MTDIPCSVAIYPSVSIRRGQDKQFSSHFKILISDALPRLHFTLKLFSFCLIGSLAHAFRSKC